MKHAKRGILCSKPSTPFYEARQTRKHAKFIDHANMPSTRARQAHKARHLADSVLSFREQIVLKWRNNLINWIHEQALWQSISKEKKIFLLMNYYLMILLTTCVKNIRFEIYVYRCTDTTNCKTFWFFLSQETMLAILKVLEI